jgi:hypothetical protein
VSVQGVPNLGRCLTTHEVALIRKLRADGYFCREVADVVGCSIHTVNHYAPGHIGKVPVAPLREAFLASPMTAADVARELGWWAGRAADCSRVRRTLGLAPDISGSNGRKRISWRRLVDAETVQLIAEAIGVSPWSVLPDDEDEA